MGDPLFFLESTGPALLLRVCLDFPVVCRDILLNSGKDKEEGVESDEGQTAEEIEEALSGGKDADEADSNGTYGQSGGNKGKKGKEKRSGKKKDRDKWYGNNDKNFQKWWERKGKEEFNYGQDIEDADNAREALDYWNDIKRPKG